MPDSDKTEGSVFLSYRRDDSPMAAGRLHDRLKEEFGAERIFKDVDSIPAGLDFRKVIDEEVGKCAVMVVVMGPKWYGGAKKGNRRIDSATDFVRIEVEAALRREIPVIPVLVGDFEISVDRLPETLVELGYRQARRLRYDPDFNSDVNRILRDIDSLLKRVALSRLEEHVGDADAHSSEGVDTTELSPAEMRGEKNVYVCSAEADLRKAQMISAGLVDAGWSVFTLVPSRPASLLGLYFARCIVVLWSPEFVVLPTVQEITDIAARQEALVDVIVGPVDLGLRRHSSERVDLTFWNGDTAGEDWRQFVETVARVAESSESIQSIVSKPIRNIRS